MKTLMIVLSLSLSACFAHTALAADTFEVNGARGAALENALVAAGAVPRVMVDASSFTVSNLSCTEGYQVGFGPFANCTFFELVPILRHATSAQTFNVQGEKARALIAALEDAGVQGHHGVELTSYSVESADCFSSLVGGGNGAFGKGCTLTVSE